MCKMCIFYVKSSHERDIEKVYIRITQNTHSQDQREERRSLLSFVWVWTLLYEKFS